MTWLSDTKPHQRHAMTAAFLGYGLDGYDFMMYSLIIPTLMSSWGISNTQAGSIASVSLFTSAIGGWGAGLLADRHGRARIMQLTVLWFATFTFLSGFTHSYGELLFTRAMQGFGFGGQWAVGSVLVSETVDARHRGRAAGLVQSSWSFGWALAALGWWAASSLLGAALGWRVLFWSGILPVLIIFYIRRKVAEPEIHLAARARVPAEAGAWLRIFAPPLLRHTVLATMLSAGMLTAYYSVTSWLPTYLQRERHLGGFGQTGYLLMVIAGSFIGYLSSAWLSDTVGRRRAFMAFAACGALLIVAYTRSPWNGGLLVLGFALGFFVLGIFSGMGACFTELYPSALRGSGQGFCYSMGRAIGGCGPLLIGAWGDHVPLALSIPGVTVAGYALVILAAWALPETRGRRLDELERQHVSGPRAA